MGVGGDPVVAAGPDGREVALGAADFPLGLDRGVVDAVPVMPLTSRTR